ncbi:hemolysin family protein [Roseovarius sp.]|uniref:hemolysin family protein n=1 Tax=Roseovarius sp. TaxID=1486281 RepID=UPI00261B164E|nr:hemolysin family protein [Roseovarius sp.]MDM8166863.1 hemolysin family protein [Roseovarius sp.]
MGDSTDGSSNAARCAQVDSHESEEEQGGFFRRIFDAFSTGEENGEDEGASAPRSAAPGLGNLRTLTVEDVSVPKADIVAVPIDITKDELVSVFRDSGKTRLPVYDGTLDSPVGMAHLKDFALSYGFNGKGGRFSLKPLVRPLLYVPPSMPIGVLLQNMQNERRHMALVIDEYGGVDGLVTIEDLIEQVVGEIEDEHDTGDDTYWMQEKPGTYLAQAKTPLDEFEEEIGQSLTEAEEVDEEEIDTLGGLVFMLLGRVPVRGEMVEHPDGTVFEVVEADPRRIKRLRVRLPGHTDA